MFLVSGFLILAPNAKLETRNLKLETLFPHLCSSVFICGSTKLQNRLGVQNRARARLVLLNLLNQGRDVMKTPLIAQFLDE